MLSWQKSLAIVATLFFLETGAAASDLGFDIAVAGFPNGGVQPAPLLGRTLLYTADGALKVEYPLNVWASDLAFDSTGNLYVSTELSTGPGRTWVVRQFTPGGVARDLVTSETVLSGIAIDDAGNIFTVKAGANGSPSHILRISAGVVSSDNRQLTPNLFVKHLEVTGCELYYSPQWFSSEIHRVDLCGNDPETVITFQGPFSVSGIAARSDGSLLVSTVDRISVVSNSGAVEEIYAPPSPYGVVALTSTPAPDPGFLAIESQFLKTARVIRFSSLSAQPQALFEVPYEVVNFPSGLATSSATVTPSPVPTANFMALTTCALLLILVGSRMLR